ncbi:MAG TPA: transcriptional regulator [Methanosarcinaceae archaeon]|nr:transcriptional regulator [Methanosarcinaceae archaeon]
MSVLEMPEIWVFLIAILAAFILYKVLKTAKKIIINIVVGFVILIAGNIGFGLGIDYTNWIVILTCALSGAFGAILIILLKFLNIAF